MSPGRRAVALGTLAALLGGVAASDVHDREAAVRRSIGPLIPVLVAARPIPAGAAIGRRRLAVRQVPLRFAPRGAYRHPIEVEGARAAVRIAAGSDLTRALIAGPEQAPGTTRLAPAERVARVVAVGASAELRRGSRADVLVSAAQGGATRVLLSGAEVLASRPASPPAGVDGPASELPHVLLGLRVTLRQAVRLAQAQSAGAELRALARP